ncbi:hypothetical protein AIJ49_22710 [Salmonella enterica subsp. enterica serovar Enteritidis]|nr:hypothetical protein AIJ49_22710 [Salmonella enterica subsp. enterica serovar Enteritidis]
MPAICCACASSFSRSAANGPRASWRFFFPFPPGRGAPGAASSSPAPPGGQTAGGEGGGPRPVF